MKPFEFQIDQLTIHEIGDQVIMLSIAESDKDIVIERLEAQLKTAKATIDGLNKELLEAKEVLGLFAIWFKDNGYITDADIEEGRLANAIVPPHER